MIRIDEIYYNTFLPKVQAKSVVGLHWFDPFGSVKFEDLCNVPPIPDVPDARRYLFWDQEPLHQELVDQTLSKFVQMFSKGRRHIITSEQDSAMVRYVENTYGFRSHYYFFHGWAALDWFRGYNRSFLMPDYKDRQITKTFIAPNRIIAGERQHRLVMLYNIFKYGMQNNHISCPAVCAGENITIEQAIKPLLVFHPDMEEVFAQQQFPINMPGESGSPMHSCWLSLFAESAESLIYLVTETVANGRRQHLTEKTFKPICLKMPFVIVGCQGSLAYLRQYGFKTFGHVWDESYDNEIHDDQRIEKIAFTLKAIDILPQHEKQRLFNIAQEVCEHNYNHFYNGGFEQVLWAELEGMLRDMNV